MCNVYKQTGHLKMSTLCQRWGEQIRCLSSEEGDIPQVPKSGAKRNRRIAEGASEKEASDTGLETLNLESGSSEDQQGKTPFVSNK